MAPAQRKVFISYSRDSPEHEELVLRFAQRLRKDGIDAQIDQYVGGRPAGGWPRWMLDRLDWAQFVLLICTETYYRRFRGHETPDSGRGVDWEGQLITLEIYNAKSHAAHANKRAGAQKCLWYRPSLFPCTRFMATIVGRDVTLQSYSQACQVRRKAARAQTSMLM